MKKLLTATALTAAAIASTSAMAQDDYFVGLEYGKAKHYANVYATDGVDSFQGSDSDKANTYGIRVGKYLNDNVRVYANLNQGKIKDDGDKHTMRQLTASADYVFDLGPVKPFVGATLGANQAKAKINNDDDGISGSDSSYALAYGAQVGVMAQFGQVDVEAGYRYLRHKNDINVSNAAGTMKLDYKKSKTPYVSVSYRF